LQIDRHPASGVNREYGRHRGLDYAFGPQPWKNDPPG
jgi:hypothetical protein